MLQQEGHTVVHFARLDDVVVVEHQHDIVRDGVEFVEKGGKPRFGRRLGRMQIKGDCSLVQRGDKIRPKHFGIVVALIEREPRRGLSRVGSGRQPLRQQGGLPEPGRS
ncbi:MAG TPA: hypothetical protein VGD15_07640 [Kribbella sp.]